MTRLCALVFVALAATEASAAELKAATVSAFNQYVAAAEKQRTSDRVFLWTDGDEPARRRAGEALKRQGFAFEPIVVRDGGRELAVPDGLVHHWLGVVFVPRATLSQGLALLQDYDRHAQIYKPAVARSRLISRDGDRFTLFLRFFMKKVITVVVNSEHEARFTQHDATRAESRIYSTRIAEVENPDTPREREKPVGQDGGYLWRLNSYWRFLERDGGLYLQCESISLTRGIPIGLGWIVRPYVTSIPRETLTFTLETSRAALQRSASGH